jgi:hypothetical protein
MKNDNKGSAVLLIVLIILIAALVTGMFVAQNAFIGLKITGNQKSYVQGIYSLDSVSSWFLEDPDRIIDSATTKYTNNEEDRKLILSSLLPDYEIPNQGNLRDNVKMEIALGITSMPKPGTGNSVWHTQAYNFHATITDKKIDKKVLTGRQSILPKAN